MGVKKMQDLPIEMKLGLREFGLQEARLAKFSMKTRVLKDMRVCGDQFVALYENLADAYESTNPPPEEFMPSQGSSDCFFVTLGGFIPFFDRFVKAPDLTLRALDSHLRE